MANDFSEPTLANLTSFGLWTGGGNRYTRIMSGTAHFRQFRDFEWDGYY